jgi:opacity protein-like surface antigen
MSPARSRRAILGALLAASVSVAAQAADDMAAAGIPLMYGLAGDPLTEQSLMAMRWSSPLLSLRLDAAAGLGAHELRILSAGSKPQLGPQFSGFTGAEPLAEGSLDSVRATYRYTLLAKPEWALKLGLSANLTEPASGLRAGIPGTDRTGFGSLPMVHLAGVGHWSPRWRLGFALDGLATTRGRALDLGVEVDYLWSRSMSLYGGYQVTEAAGEAEGYYGSGLTNRANIGLRYRF